MLTRLLTIAALIVAPFFVSASQYGTAEEAEAMLARAEAVFQGQGLEALSTQVMNESDTELRDRDLYVFVIDMEGTMVAHGANAALVGRDMTSIKDPNGVAFVVEFISVASSTGRGWVDYVWANPQTKKLESKSSLVVSLGNGHLAGVGIYKH